MILREKLSARKLPALETSGMSWEERRKEILQILSEQEYGISPPPVKSSWTLDSEKVFYAGKAAEKRLTVQFETPKGPFSFPLYLAIPQKEEPVPCILQINFHRPVPNAYCPAEEIIDAGFAIAHIFYEDVTSDDGDMENGLAGCFSLAERDASGMGKIGCWAYAMSRAMDVLLEQPEIRKDAVVTAGHSRLGKTSLWCAAQDTRFAGCITNDSGCSGDAITRSKKGERVADITKKFPYWFCENYQQYRGREEEMPFDQHFLLAAIAPRLLAVGTALLDEWADPESELLSCMAAAPVWGQYGGEPLVVPAEMPGAGTVLETDRIHFHLRGGTHFFSREDWQYYLKYFSSGLELGK